MLPCALQPESIALLPAVCHRQIHLQALLLPGADCCAGLPSLPSASAFCPMLPGARSSFSAFIAALHAAYICCCCSCAKALACSPPPPSPPPLRCRKLHWAALMTAICFETSVQCCLRLAALISTLVAALHAAYISCCYTCAEVSPAVRHRQVHLQALHHCQALLLPGADCCAGLPSLPSASTFCPMLPGARSSFSAFIAALHAAYICCCCSCAKALACSPPPPSPPPLRCRKLHWAALMAAICFETSVQCCLRLAALISTLVAALHAAYISCCYTCAEVSPAVRHRQVHLQALHHCQALLLPGADCCAGLPSLPSASSILLDHA